MFHLLIDTSVQQTRRWLDAGIFEAIVHDLRTLLRLAEGRAGQPSAALLDSRTRQATPESGGRAGYDGHKRESVSFPGRGVWESNPPSTTWAAEQRF